MSKKLTTLTKELDFKETYEYFDYMASSHFNGNFSQCKDLFKAMRYEDKKQALNYIKGNYRNENIYNFYFNLL